MPITRTYYKVHRVFPDPDYFYLENISGSTANFSINKSGTPASTDLAYSFDKVTWTDIHNGGTISNVANGAKVYLRSSTGFNLKDNYYRFNIGVNFNAGGHIATLFNYKNTSSVTSIPDYGCYYMFYQSKLVHTNIDFYGIKSIGIMGCYYMFNYCMDLINVPDFSSVETLEETALSDMFTSCSSLNTPLDLSNVTSCAVQALSSLYRFCSSLTEAIAPNVSTWTSSYGDWLYGVASTGVVRKPAGLEIPTDTSYGIPTGWTTEDY